jgi:type IV pilus modification protein PilV
MNGRGFTMFEVLVALLLLAVAVSSVLALGLRGFAATAEARRAEVAGALAADLAGRVRAFAAVDWTALPAPAPCPAACPPEQLAALELADWRAAVATALPDGAALLASGPAGELLLTLAWTETGGVSRELRVGIAR